jgi:hypothetical protein
VRSTIHNAVFSSVTRRALDETINRSMKEAAPAVGDYKLEFGNMAS